MKGCPWKQAQLWYNMQEPSTTNEHNTAELTCVSVMKLLMAITTGMPNRRTFSTCFWRLTNPAASRSRFSCEYTESRGFPAATVGPPPCILRALIVATSTAQLGTRPAIMVVILWTAYSITSCIHMEVYHCIDIWCWKISPFRCRLQIQPQLRQSLPPRPVLEPACRQGWRSCREQC